VISSIEKAKNIQDDNKEVKPNKMKSHCNHTTETLANMIPTELQSIITFFRPNTTGKHEYIMMRGVYVASQIVKTTGKHEYHEYSENATRGPICMKPGCIFTCCIYDLCK
jgi:hypothetical protein